MRQGRSRFWFADQRFWIIFADFQPSGWSKGSYLNMGVKWLWESRPFLDISDRPFDFIPFENKEQFWPLIRHMAEIAAQEALKLRAKFRSLADIHHYLMVHASRDGWPGYHAAIASGLIDDVATSKLLFERMRDWATDGYDWQLELKADLRPRDEYFTLASVSSPIATVNEQPANEGQRFSEAFANNW